MELGEMTVREDEIIEATNTFLPQVDNIATTNTFLPPVSSKKERNKKIKRTLGKVLFRSHSTGDIQTLCYTDGEEIIETQESHLQEADRWRTKIFTESLSNILGDDVQEDSFQKEVAQKTQIYMVGRQEAETDVAIDKLIRKEGSKDRALLHVVTQMTLELKVQIFVNTLLQRGANPSISDNNWQTPLHHAVKKGFKGVVNELLENDALPHARDKDRKYPFHLAVEDSQDEIGALLLKYMPNHVVRELFITYTQNAAECTLHDLLKREMHQSALAVMDSMIDKIGQTSHMKVYYHILDADEKGRPPSHPKFEQNSKSSLHIISKEGHMDLVSHFVVRLLIRRKWNEFARLRFQLNLSMFLVTLLFLTFSVVTAVMTPDPTLYDEPLHIARAVFEMWSILAVILTCFLEINQFRKQKLDYWRDKFNWIDLCSSCLLLTVVPLRFRHCQEQWQVYSVGYLLWTLRIFKYAAVFRQTGAYAQILWRIVSNDFIQFTVLFLVILICFSGSFVLALRGERDLDVHEETNSFWNILFTGVRILIEGQPVVEYTGSNGYRPMSCILMVAFLFVCCVVLLSILVAQLSDTYQNVQKDAERGLVMNRAWIITRVELNSLFIGKGYRSTKYLEMEELNNPMNELEKWESPILNEISKDVKDMNKYLKTTEMSMLTIKNRLSRQEFYLRCLQDQLELLVQKLTKTESTNSE